MHGLFFGGLFWGLLISLIGLSIVLKHGFNIDLHLVRIFIGLIIILFGIKLIVGYNSKTYVNTIKSKVHFNNGKEHDILFSNGTIDLTQYQDISKYPKEINVIFGNGVVLIPDNINLEVTSTTVFGSTIMPNRSYAGFGEDVYSINNKPDAPSVKIVTATVFGKLVMEVVPSKAAADSTKKEDSF